MKAEDGPLDGLAAQSALAKAAVLAHWVPGVGFAVHQVARPALRVAAFADPRAGADRTMHPCEFRRLLAGDIRARATGLPGHFDFDTHLCIEVFTDHTTRVSEHGMCLRRMDPQRSMMAFASVISVDHVGGDLRSATDGDVEVEVLHMADTDIDSGLAFTWIDHRDRCAFDAATEVMCRFMAACGAAETVRALRSVVDPQT